MSPQLFFHISKWQSLKQFTPARGLRQADLISLYLFILCDEVLSRLLQKAQDEWQVSGIVISRRCLAISHLMLVDNVFLFGRASSLEAEAMRDCLVTYQWSSVVFSPNFKSSCKQPILCVLSMREIVGDVKYLGNPLFFLP